MPPLRQIESFQRVCLKQTRNGVNKVSAPSVGYRVPALTFLASDGACRMARLSSAAVTCFCLIDFVATCKAEGPQTHRNASAAAFTVAAVLTHREALDRPHDIELQGNIAYVPGKGGSLAIVDVSHPTAPKILWHRHDPTGLNDAETILPVGKDRLFLGTNEFHSIDVANPVSPVFQARVSDRRQIARINGMVRHERWILAASKHGWLNAFDISDETPVLTGAVDLRLRFGVHSPHDVDLADSHVVVADPGQFDRTKQPGKLAVIRVFDDERNLLPANEWTLSGVAVSKDLAGANRVQVSGSHAFVGASTRTQGGKLVVIDLKDVTAPQQIASLPFAPDDGWGPNGLTVAGDVVFLAGGQSVEAIDVSNPRHPVLLARQRFLMQLPNANPRYRGGGDSGHDLVYRAGYLFVTGQNDHCLLVLRVEMKRIHELALRTEQLGTK